MFKWDLQVVSERVEALIIEVTSEKSFYTSQEEMAFLWLFQTLRLDSQALRGGQEGTTKKKQNPEKSAQSRKPRR
ncbi:hypothetical protein Tco_1304151 [Tanacetum coccineum]